MELKEQRFINTDVLVIGGGGAGLRAAIESRKADRKVIIAAKYRVGYACNTAISGGFMAAATGWDARDPGKTSQFVKPWGEMEVSEYEKFGWNAEDAKAYSKAYSECFNSDTMLPYLRIRGAFEYWVALDRNLSEAMIGRMTPKKALDRCAKDWKQITSRLGKDEQMKFYRESIGYQP